MYLLVFIVFICLVQRVTTAVYDHNYDSGLPTAVKKQVILDSLIYKFEVMSDSYTKQLETLEKQDEDLNYKYIVDMTNRDLDTHDVYEQHISALQAIRTEWKSVVADQEE
jgi:C-terminal processing protease CtpA/Prc